MCVAAVEAVPGLCGGGVPTAVISEWYTCHPGVMVTIILSDADGASLDPAQTDRAGDVLIMLSP